MSRINCNLFNFYGENDLDYILKNPIDNISSIKLPLFKLDNIILKATDDFIKQELQNQSNKPFKKRKRRVIQISRINLK